VTIAAILLFLLGGIQLALSITEFFRSSISVLPPLGGGSNILWGGLDVLYALVIIYAGYALLQWQTSGRVIALLIVVLYQTMSRYWEIIGRPPVIVRRRLDDRDQGGIGLQRGAAVQLERIQLVQVCWTPVD
jgi:hypothetical protein